MNDSLVFALYILNCAVTAYAFALFFWWWRNQKWKASSVYIYVTVLFGGQTIRNAIEVYTFYYRVILNSTQAQLESAIYEQWWWPLRLIIPMMVTVCIVGHLTFRVLKSKHDDGD